MRKSDPLRPSMGVRVPLGATHPPTPHPLGIWDTMLMQCTGYLDTFHGFGNVRFYLIIFHNDSEVMHPRSLPLVVVEHSGLVSYTLPADHLIQDENPT